MKKNILSVIALILALVSLILCGMTISAAWDMADRYDAQLDWLNERYASLEARLEALESQEYIPGSTEAPEESLAYCNLIIGDWTFENGTLTVSTAFAQAMAEHAAPESAAMVLRVNGEAAHEHPIEMVPGEASHSYELDLNELTFALPELPEGALVELCLEVTLSDATVLSACGGNWDYLGGELLMIAG